EEDGSVALGEVADELGGLFEALRRLGEIDDVDAGPLREDEAAHLRVPATRLVAEMDSGLQQLAHGDDCHEAPSVVDFGAAPAGSGRTGRRGRHPRHGLSTGSGEWIPPNSSVPRR